MTSEQTFSSVSQEVWKALWETASRAMCCTSHPHICDLSSTRPVDQPPICWSHEPTISSSPFQPQLSYGTAFQAKQVTAYTTAFCVAVLEGLLEPSFSSLLPPPTVLPSSCSCWESGPSMDWSSHRYRTRFWAEICRCWMLKQKMHFWACKEQKMNGEHQTEGALKNHQHNLDYALDVQQKWTLLSSRRTNPCFPWRASSEIQKHFFYPRDGDGYSSREILSIEMEMERKSSDFWWQSSSPRCGMLLLLTFRLAMTTSLSNQNNPPLQDTAAFSLGSQQKLTASVSGTKALTCKNSFCPHNHSFLSHTERHQKNCFPPEFCFSAIPEIWAGLTPSSEAPRKSNSWKSKPKLQ